MHFLGHYDFDMKRIVSILFCITVRFLRSIRPNKSPVFLVSTLKNSIPLNTVNIRLNRKDISYSLKCSLKKCEVSFADDIHKMVVLQCSNAKYFFLEPVTGEFPAQRASNAENVSIWWRHHVINQCWPIMEAYLTSQTKKIKIVN